MQECSRDQRVQRVVTGLRVEAPQPLSLPRRQLKARHFEVCTGQGWEVREESDREVVRLVRYRDWHRVERARMRIDAEVLALEDRGWSTTREG